MIVEMFSRFLSGYAESKSTIRSMLDNPVYTGRLYWNRLARERHLSRLP